MSHDSRVAALDGLLEEAGLDAVLATKDASIAYLTGFWGLQMERFFGVAVKRGGDGALIAPSLDRESVNAAPTGLDSALYTAAISNGLAELLRSTLDGAKRIGVEEDHLNFARSQRAAGGRLRAGARHRPDHAAARGQGRRGGRGRPPRLHAHRGRLRRAVGRAEARHDRGRDQRPRRVQPDAPRREALRAAHPLRRALGRLARHAGRARARARRRRSSPTSPAQFDGYWGDLTRCAHAGPAERLGGQGVGRRARGLRRRGRRHPPRQHHPRRRRRPARRSSRPIPRSAPACTAPATRSAPRSTSRRS